MKRKVPRFSLSVAALAGLGVSLVVLAGGRLPLFARPEEGRLWLTACAQAAVLRKPG